MLLYSTAPASAHPVRSFSFPHFYRSPHFDGRPGFATMMQFPCPRSSRPYSPICVINARASQLQELAAAHPILMVKTLHEFPPRQHK